MWFRGPKHTVGSVARTLLAGLEAGTIVSDSTSLTSVASTQPADTVGNLYPRPDDVVASVSGLTERSRCQRRVLGRARLRVWRPSYRPRSRSMAKQINRFPLGKVTYWTSVVCDKRSQ